MTRDTIRIDKLHREHIVPAAALLARSFSTTSDYVHMFPRVESRVPALRGFMQAPVRDANEAVPFYLRAGFTIDAEGVPLMPGGPTYWLMTRPPS